MADIWQQCRGLREQGGEASKAAGSELIISLCKAADRMAALKVYQDMTSPTPTHHLHTLPGPGKKGVSKSAAKRQRAKQRQEAGDAAAVGAAARASRAAATAVGSQAAGDSASETQQVDFERHHGDSGTRNQTANLPALTGNTSQTGAHLPNQTAEQLAEAYVDGELSPPSASALSTARQGGRSPNNVGAQKASPAVPPKSPASQPWTDTVTPSRQATASDPTNGHVSGLQTTTETPVRFSSSASSSDDPASMPAVDVLLLKPDRQQPSEPADATYASSASEHTSDVSSQHDSAELLQHSDPPHNPYTFGGALQQQDRSPGGESVAGLGSSGDNGGGPNGAQAGAILGKRPVAPASSSDSMRGHARLVSSLKLSQRAICFPSIGATAALVHAFAIAGDIQECFR